MPLIRICRLSFAIALAGGCRKSTPIAVDDARGPVRLPFDEASAFEKLRALRLEQCVNHPQADLYHGDAGIHVTFGGSGAVTKVDLITAGSEYRRDCIVDLVNPLRIDPFEGPPRTVGCLLTPARADDAALGDDGLRGFGPHRLECR
jgi:hypothetical protein